jgi:hypothetical protein
MSILKIISAVIAAFGLIFFLYGFSENSAGAILQVGGLFLATAAIIFSMSVLDVKLVKLAHILSDLDSTLTVPSVKLEPPPLKQKNIGAAVAGGVALGAGAVAHSFTKSEEVKLPQDTIPKRDYFNELAQYLEPLPEAHDEAAPAAPAKSEPKFDVQAFDLALNEPPTPPPAAMPRVNDMASDFPELDAILNKKEPPKAEPLVQIQEPILAPQPAPSAPALIREGVINGVNFRLFSDGSIDADFSNGSHRFATLAEFRQYVDPKA